MTRHRQYRRPAGVPTALVIVISIVTSDRQPDPAALCDVRPRIGRSGGSAPAGGPAEHGDISEAWVHRIDADVPLRVLQCRRLGEDHDGAWWLRRRGAAKAHRLAPIVAARQSAVLPCPQSHPVPHLIMIAGTMCHFTSCLHRRTATALPTDVTFAAMMTALGKSARSGLSRRSPSGVMRVSQRPRP
jgi:hypothetical protein